MQNAISGLVVGSGEGWIARHGFMVGQRVESRPGCDCWMRGDRYGTVEKIGSAFVHVRMDRSGRVLKFHPANLTGV